MSIATYYRVSIDGSSLGSLPAPRDGFIDNRSVEQYVAANGGTLPTNLATSRAKERANLRYDQVIGSTGLMCNLFIDNITATGATVSLPASTFAFTMEAERGDTVLDTHDEFNAGARLTGTLAIRRCVARAMVIERMDIVDIYDPTATPAPGNATNAQRRGVLIERLTAGPLVTSTTPQAAMLAAEALITVTKIANVN